MATTVALRQLRMPGITFSRAILAAPRMPILRRSFMILPP
jgi:hypothetical protein